MNKDKHDRDSEILMRDQDNQETINQFLLRILLEHPAEIAFFVLAIVLLTALANLFVSSSVGKIIYIVLLFVVILSLVFLVLSRNNVKTTRNDIDRMWVRIEIMDQLMERQIQIMKSLNGMMLSRFKVSLSHPKLLAKRHSSHFKVRIYPGAMGHIVRFFLDQEKSEKDIVEQEFSSNITAGEIVEVKLFSPVIDFSPSVTKKIMPDINLCSFTGIPKDECNPDTHAAILTITQKETGVEILNIPFDLKIADFVFDHVSRPFFSNVISAILGASSVVTYILTLFGQIDTVLGVTSGTTAVVIAAVLQIRVFSLYKNMSQTVQHP